MSELKSRMSVTEFRRWQLFYEMQPFDDLHLFYRPAALLAAVMGSGDVGKMMSFLLNKSEEVVDDVDLSVFAAFGVEPPANFRK